MTYIYLVNELFDKYGPNKCDICGKTESYYDLIIEYTFGFCCDDCLAKLTKDQILNLEVERRKK